MACSVDQCETTASALCEQMKTKRVSFQNFLPDYGFSEFSLSMIISSLESQRATESAFSFVFIVCPFRGRSFTLVFLFI